MNTNMRNDLNNALRQRLVIAVQTVNAGLQVTPPDDETVEQAQARDAQLEADMDRLRQIFRFSRADRYEQAYNVLSTVGSPPEGVAAPVEPTPDPAVEPPVTG